MGLTDTLQEELIREKKYRQKNSTQFRINNPSQKKLVQKERKKEYFSADPKQELHQGAGM